MITMTNYKFNSIHSLLFIHEQLDISTSSLEKADWLRSLQDSFPHKYNNRFSVRVSFYFSFAIRAFLLLSTPVIIGTRRRNF